MLQLSLGYGLQILIDEGFSAANPDGLRKAVVFIVSVGAAMAFGAMIRFYLVSWLGERVSADLVAPYSATWFGCTPATSSPTRPAK